MALGKEIGTTIMNDGNIYWLNAISFHQRWNKVDHLLYRINIYTLKNDLPDSSILQKELFVIAYKEDNWVPKQLMIGRSWLIRIFLSVLSWSVGGTIVEKISYFICMAKAIWIGTVIPG